MLIGKAKIGKGPYRDMTRFEATMLLWSTYADLKGRSPQVPRWSKHCEKAVNNFLANSSIVKLSRSLPIVYLALFR